ncbi:histidine phosphatase family protein [Phycicoccus sp. MQZ13P-5]|uniref:Histidine phosphatase family protein n=2 Tax=Phycicoccus sonneratiae TaxID=2807628 RepID=A0ABS2CIK3_9MICO|nr:histidine phosphatase family protein [Phycicoccus sonneraticus]
MAAMPGRLVLVRHGETEWSATGRHTGRTDVPLTERGEAQARSLRPALESMAVARVLCSPLARARRTAELAGLSPETDEDLLEWDYGGYEGLTTPQIRKQLADPDWTVFRDGVVPGDTPGETVEEVSARASRVLARVEGSLADGDVVLVAHGHLLRVLAATRLRQEPRFGAHLLLEPATLCLLDEEHGVPAVRGWNIEPPRG